MKYSTNRETLSEMDQSDDGPMMHVTIDVTGAAV